MLEKFTFTRDDVAFDVRVVMIDEEPWWVASDVCKVLGVTNVGNALSRVNGLDIRSTDVENARGRMVQTKIVNESGLYDLILDSRKPWAREFRRFVTAEILPTIRKTGGAYIAPGSPAELDLLDPDTMLDKLAEVVTIAREARAKAAKLEVEIQGQAPYVEMATQFYSKEGLTCLQDTARLLSVKPSVFNRALRDWGWLTESGAIAKAYAVEQGYMENKWYDTPTGRKPVQGMMTRRGIERACIRLDKAG